AYYCRCHNTAEAPSVAQVGCSSDVEQCSRVTGKPEVNFPIADHWRTTLPKDREWQSFPPPVSEGSFGMGSVNTVVEAIRRGSAPRKTCAYFVPFGPTQN